MTATPLLIQEYLRTKTLGELEDEYGVEVSFSRSRPYKFSVNYSQIESKPGPLVNQCRGLVLAMKPNQVLYTDPLQYKWDRSDVADALGDSKALRKLCPGETVVLARPFDRFFNQGDVNCAPVDWNDPELAILEKLDGTLAIVYYDDYAGTWCMATRSVPDADLPFSSWGRTLTYRQLFDEALYNTLWSVDCDTSKLHLDEMMRHADKEVTHLFELTSPLNRIVVRYVGASLTWLASRRRSGEELNYHEAVDSVMGAVTRSSFPPPVRKFPISTLPELRELLDRSDPMALEGVVVMDSEYRRIKVKSLAWLAANRVKTSCGSERSVMSLILDEKIDDAMEFLDDVGKKRVEVLQDGLRTLLNTLNIAHDSFSASSETQKDYALKVTASGLWSSPLFEMRAKKLNAKLWLYSKRDKLNGWPDNLIDRLVGVIDATH